MTNVFHKCIYCDKRAVTHLDGDWLCRRHADAWVRAEGEAAHDREVNAAYGRRIIELFHKEGNGSDD